jgi:hypothetical protein
VVLLAWIKILADIPCLSVRLVQSSIVDEAARMWIRRHVSIYAYVTSFIKSGPR